MTKHIFWIASYPKSGNTLLRAILSALFFSDTGVFNFNLLKKIVGFEELSRLNKCYDTRVENINSKNWREMNILIYKNMIEIQNKINLGFTEDFAFFKTHFNGKNFDGQSFFVNNYLRGLIYIYRDPRDICVSWARHSSLTKSESLEFMLNDSASIKWIGQEKFKKYKSNIPVYLSTWEKHVKSWIDSKFNCPNLFLNYEDLIYDKKNVIVNLINFFENNYKIKITNKNLKIENIINSTSFDFLQKLEINKGFNESVSSNKFFAVGKSEQWKTELEQNQINIIEKEFGSTMKRLKYKLNKQLN
ncbi:sulfotransferase domain-containing protein [Pelagibacteraceae bacterium]|nr:sulfotransferase domain-containing protein [Pelagibacteraceae bacterium]